MTVFAASNSAERQGFSGMKSLRLLLLAFAAAWLAAPMAEAAGASAAAGDTPAPVRVVGFPWRAGDPPPQVRGVALGDNEQRVRELLGEPGGTSKMGSADVLDYSALGLQFVLTKTDGVAIIRLETTDAAALDDIRVGAAAQDVLAKWGPPHEAQERTALYNAGNWTVTVRLAAQAPKVTDLALGLNTIKWADLAPPQPAPPNPAANKAQPARSNPDPNRPQANRPR